MSGEERRDERITRTLAFRILVAANRLARPFPERIGRAHDLTLPEWRAMMALAAQPGASGEEVAQALGTDRMGVSRALRRLEAAGRTERRDGVGNSNSWYLSEAGWALFDTVAPLALERDATLLSGLDEDERAAIATLFDRMDALD